MNKPRILVVDDRAEVLEAVSEVLSDRGMLIDTARSAAEAKRKLDKPAAPDDEYDVIVTDMVMARPNSGLEVLKAAGRLTPSTPVIVLTAHGDIADSIACMKAGAFSYLAKRGEKGELELLVEHVRRALHYRTSLRLSLPFFNGLDRALQELGKDLSSLGVINAQLKSLSDTRNRLLRGLSRSKKTQS